MTRYLVILFAIIAWPGIVLAQKTSKEFSRYVKFESSPGPGMITVVSTGFAKKKPESSADAVQNAFHALLYVGIPGSQYELPFLSGESASPDNAIIKELSMKGYSDFITGNKLIAEENATKKDEGVKGKMTTHRITINCDGLRRYLEEKGLIRKFGI